MEDQTLPPDPGANDGGADVELLKVIASNPDTAALLARMAKGEDISGQISAPAAKEIEKEPLYRGPENSPYVGPRSYDGFLSSSRPGFWD